MNNICILSFIYRNYYTWLNTGWMVLCSLQPVYEHTSDDPSIHLDLFVKCSHRMRSSIILQRYGTSVILKTSLDNNTVRWWSSYIIMIMKQTTSLPTMRSNIAHLYWCQWSLSTTTVPVYIYFNISGCYCMSSIFTHHLKVHRSAKSSALCLHTFMIYIHCFAVWPFAHCTVQWLRLRSHCTVAMLADHLQRLRETFWHSINCIVVF